MAAVARVRAQTFQRKMSSGRTGPCLFACHIGEGQYQDYVVKFRDKLGTRIISEFIAALLGQHLELPIPHISIVEIDSRLADVIPDPEIQELLLKDPGPHFGSEYKIGGYMTVPHGFSIPNSLIPQG